MKCFRKFLCGVLTMPFLLAAGCQSEPAKKPSLPTIPMSATIRVMSWNILNPSWGGGPVEHRADGFIQTVSTQAPDIVGLQEASQKWHHQFGALPDQYVAVNARTASDRAALTTFLYNQHKLDLVENGIIDLDANSDIRIVSWAVFSVKDTAVKFLITNTHPDARDAQCIAHTNTYLDIVERLAEEKRLPLICVGDFNAVEASAQYLLHIEDGFTDAKYNDTVNVLNDIDSYLEGDYGGIVTSGKGSRDHVFFKDGVTAVTFTTLSDNAILTVSDHLPILAELKIGK